MDNCKPDDSPHRDALPKRPQSSKSLMQRRKKPPTRADAADQHHLAGRSAALCWQRELARLEAECSALKDVSRRLSSQLQKSEDRVERLARRRAQTRADLRDLYRRHAPCGMRATVHGDDTTNEVLVLLDERLKSLRTKATAKRGSPSDAAGDHRNQTSRPFKDVTSHETSTCLEEMILPPAWAEASSYCSLRR